MVSFAKQDRPKGGPDGGTGGVGAPVILVAGEGKRDLKELTGLSVIAGEAGHRGGTNGRTGKGSVALQVKVPVGTAVYTKETEDAVWAEETDLAVAGARVLVARGGAGGRGNTAFATPTNQAPVLAETGAEGETRVVALELRLGSDLVLIGAPNAGKSRLLSALTGARPRVADYPFTTVDPVPGVLDLGDRGVVLLELPGLAEGASEGAGLGSGHLRHALRASVIAYVVDGAAGRLVDEYRRLRDEVAAYGRGLDETPTIVVVTKADLADAAGLRRSLEAVRRASRGPVVSVSAASGEGLDALRAEIAGMVPVRRHDRADPPSTELPPVGRRDGRVAVEVRGRVFEVSCLAAERLIPMVDVQNWRARLQLHAELGRLGVLEALEKRGVRTGDTVRIGGRELQWE